MTVNSPNNVTLTNAGNWMAGFAVKECIYADNYYISATLTCPSDNFAASEDVSLGLVPYYVNDNNFVVVYLQWTDSRVIKSIGCTGTQICIVFFVRKNAIKTLEANLNCKLRNF